ncbi:HAMP domain-containing protein [Christensenellaceae bacterium OttesenSCG-928-K19]|nr:HAMP domain-containing protein [Christensenellaceae bacterium OttesenSCG-928-K19]
MKLWQKISILCIIVLLLVVVTCSVLLLLSSRNTILEQSVEQAQTEQYNLHAAFSTMVSYYLDDTESSATRQSVVKYCFQQFANENSVLINDSETIYSEVTINPEEWLTLPEAYNLLPSANNQRTWQGEILDRNILIIGSTVTILSDNYDVYVVKDITPIYNSIASMVWRFVLICGIGIIVGTLLIILLVRRTSKPLITLQSTARQIANGEYSERSDVSTSDEIGALASDFNTMAKAVETHVAKLEDTAQRQKLFIGGLTHEFKTPMTSLILHSETLLTTDLSKEDAENALSHINRQCKWLESLTQKMLRFITLDEGIIKRQESVVELLDDVEESIEATLQTRKTPLKIRCDVKTLEIDYDLVKSLLINLIDNASKASNEGQAIMVSAYDNTLEVSDHGTGIPENEIARITDAFYMVDRSRSRLKGGSGLGLALVKQIADAHGAQLIIESEVGKGTTVRVVFPPITKI